MDTEKAPRSELLKTIEHQKDLILRREQRLRDVISAYKGVCKEKEALESSIRVLSQTKIKGQLGIPQRKELSSATDLRLESNKDIEDGSTENLKSSDALNSKFQSFEVSSSDKDELQQQVETLSHSIFTLTQEKSKLEATYIAEKKTMKQENEDLQKKVKDLLEKTEKLENDISQEQLEWKNRVRSLQVEREKQQTDHAVMLRELQKLLTNERHAKEQIEQQDCSRLDDSCSKSYLDVNECLNRNHSSSEIRMIPRDRIRAHCSSCSSDLSLYVSGQTWPSHVYEDTQCSLKEQERLVTEVSSKYEQQILAMKEEVKMLREGIKQAELKSQQPSSVLLSLQKEAAELKAKHRLLLQEDENRVKDVEIKAKAYSVQCETRIAELELKLTELSESVGNYERLKIQDQQVIQRLKETVVQLDQENKMLTDASKPAQEENSDDLPALVEKLTMLKSKLKVANSLADQPVNIGELLLDDTEIEHPLCKKYREELEQLREEFNRYRLRAQSILKNKKETTSSKDEDLLKEHVNELRDKLRALHLQQEDEIDHYKQREENLRKTMLLLQEKHKQEVSQLQAEHHSQLQELEEEIKKHRDRTVSMLAEKERELELLRSSSSHKLQSDYVIRHRPSHDVGGASSSERHSSEDEAVTRLLTTPPACQGEMTLLYFAQEQARKDIDITTLRKQKRELELAMKDLQMSSETKQQQLVEEIHWLKEEIRKLDRSICREGANLEYLKNVTYKFLICHDPVGKQQMLNAITTILQFSPQEKTTVQAQNRGWWGSAS